MTCYNAGDVVQVLVKGTEAVIGEITIHSKTCPKVFHIMVSHLLNLEKGTYSHRRKRV